MGFEEGKRTGAGGSERTMRGRGGKALALPARNQVKPPLPLSCAHLKLAFLFSASPGHRRISELPMVYLSISVAKQRVTTVI